MNDPVRRNAIAAPLGYVEPHAGLLAVPVPGQLVFKVMTVENFLRSLDGSYLHFNRVDAYHDLDPNDGAQLASDQRANLGIGFAANPQFTASNYYDLARSRTYAYCLSLENTEHIWSVYGGEDPRSKVGLCFDFDKLRGRLNKTLSSGASLQQADVGYRQIFSINYGVVSYINFAEHRLNEERLPNPIQYAHLKDAAFAGDRELRVTLSALGIGTYILDNGQAAAFPPSLQLGFDFRDALRDGTIASLLCSEECDARLIEQQLKKRAYEFELGSVERDS